MRARQDADVSFGASFELFPTLSRWFADHGAAMPDGDRAALCWAEIDHIVSTTTPDCSITLLIDNAQWLDSPSAGLVPLLAASVAGRG